MPREAGFKQDLCADMNGFSLHATVHCGADERNALEQLCRYINRPAPCRRLPPSRGTGCTPRLSLVSAPGHEAVDQIGVDAACARGDALDR
jgi:hypothetical protein